MGFSGIFAGYYSGVLIRKWSGKKAFTRADDPGEEYAVKFLTTMPWGAIISVVANLICLYRGLELGKRIRRCAILNAVGFTLLTIIFAWPIIMTD